MLKRLLPLALLVGLLAAATPASAQTRIAGCHVGTTGYEVCFNDPTGPSRDKQVIFKRLRALIGQAGAGDEIRVAMYSWTAKGAKVTKALVAARARGATVSAVVDDETEAAQVAALQAGGVNVSVCMLACLSNAAGSIQHVKLFLLTLKGQKHVVVTTSNLTGNQRDNLANDLVHSTADNELYDYLSAYWGRLFLKFDFAFANSARVKRTSQGNTVMVFPRTDRDPVVRILRGVRKCKAPHKKVWVAVARFSRPAIRARLIKLRKKYKCDARFVIGPETHKAFARKLPRSRTHYWPVHHKLLIIDATVGKHVRRVVYTGSENWSKPALDRHDEIWIGYTNPFVVNTYMGYFKQLYARAPR